MRELIRQCTRCSMYYQVDFRSNNCPHDKIQGSYEYYLSKNQPNAIVYCRAFTDLYPDSEFGPAHIVLSDYNFEYGHIIWCLTLCNASLKRGDSNLTAEDIDMLERLDYYSDFSKEEIIENIKFLGFLLTLDDLQELENELDEQCL